MVGLPNSSNTHVLNQWYQLFKGHTSLRSSQANAHWKNVERLGVPTYKNEEWKHIPLEGLFAHNFISSSARNISVSECDNLSLMFDAHRLVFFNGRFIAELSDTDISPWQVHVEEGVTCQLLPEPIQSEVFLHLSECLSYEITRIQLSAVKMTQKPLYLLHLSQGSKNKETLNTVHYRHHIELAPSANAQVIEHFVSLDDLAHFIGARTTIKVSNNAHLNHIKLAFGNRSSYHFAHNDLSIACHAVVRATILIFGSGLTRHQTSATLNGEGSDLSINSLLLPAGQDISVTRTYIEHNKEHCISRQLHKVIVRDSAKGVFNGLVKVDKCAMKTDGKITNNNLLLDRLAEVDTKPQLEIYANDVQCSHGATVGRIDDEQMFYLRSRGISRAAARQMIIYAFAAEVIKMIDNGSVRNTLLACITDALERGSV